MEWEPFWKFGEALRQKEEKKHLEACPSIRVQGLTGKGESSGWVWGRECEEKQEQVQGLG